MLRSETIFEFRASRGGLGAGGLGGVGAAAAAAAALCGGGLGGETGVVVVALAAALGIEVLEGVRRCETGLMEGDGLGAGEALVESSRTAVRILDWRYWVGVGGLVGVWRGGGGMVVV